VGADGAIDISIPLREQIEVKLKLRLKNMIQNIHIASGIM
jgi:hypothetical protein